jgi:alginate O-acetyltransferase complex protein AlgJ
MGLLARYRRYWCLLGFAVLSVPFAVQLLQPSNPASEEEARILSAAPTWPRTARDWLALPRELDRFFGDHFGLRTEMVRTHARLRYAADLPSDLRVIVGRDNWLFLNGDGTIEQSTGKVLREDQIARFADRAAALRAHLAGSGARFLVVIPPNGSTINRARLPAWAAEAAPVTEYDAMMRALATRGVDAVDLRPPLLGASAPVYRRTDTHWNRYGALIGYNAVVAALGRKDWIIDPARVLRGFVPVEGGDLARLLALSKDLDDEDAVIDLAPYGARPLEVQPFATQFEEGGDLIETGRDGPAILVLGDSFTRGFWQDYFALHTKRYVWMHHEQCAFKQSVVDAAKPNIVILAPVERQMFCH